MNPPISELGSGTKMDYNWFRRKHDLVEAATRRMRPGPWAQGANAREIAEFIRYWIHIHSRQLPLESLLELP